MLHAGRQTTRRRQFPASKCFAFDFYVPFQAAGKLPAAEQ